MSKTKELQRRAPRSLPNDPPTSTLSEWESRKMSSSANVAQYAGQHYDAKLLKTQRYLQKYKDKVISEDGNIWKVQDINVEKSYEPPIITSKTATNYARCLHDTDAGDRLIYRPSFLRVLHGCKLLSQKCRLCYFF